MNLATEAQRQIKNHSLLVQDLSNK